MDSVSEKRYSWWNRHNQQYNHGILRWNKEILYHFLYRASSAIIEDAASMQTDMPCMQVARTAKQSFSHVSIVSVFLFTENSSVVPFESWHRHWIHLYVKQKYVNLQCNTQEFDCTLEATAILHIVSLTLIFHIVSLPLFKSITSRLHFSFWYQLRFYNPMLIFRPGR